MTETQIEKLEWLRREIQKGLDDLEAGRVYDGEEVMADMMERLLRSNLNSKPSNKSIRSQE